MTEQQNTNTATAQAINLILENGLEGLAGAIAVLIDQAMLIERSNHIGAGPYERHADRDGHANGFKEGGLGRMIFFSERQIRLSNRAVQ